MQNATINGDRRVRRRYEIELPLSFREVVGRRVLLTGNGKTVDISSGGMLLEVSEPLVLGAMIEVSIEWPFSRDKSSRVFLEAAGRVVRAEKKFAALRIARHELRSVVVAHSRT